MFEIKLYSSTDIFLWNEFVEQSKNATFLFNRGYMDYHSDRFADKSLMIYRKGKLYALLPANVNQEDSTVYSHQGLTYGGLLLNTQATMSDVLTVFRMVLEYYKEIGCNIMIYKSIPYIYSRYPAQEDLYALFRFNAKVTGRNISSAILQTNKLSFIEARKSGMRKANKNAVEILEMKNCQDFWIILSENLRSRYGVYPVHSIDEINMLRTRFPDNIKHHVALYNGKIIAGCVMYLSHRVAHVQYISVNEEGKNLGALDLLFYELINNVYSCMPFFDFGQSTEQMGNYLNEALIFQKEGFGGRGIVYDIYELSI
jgi:hypothetical protein